MGRKKTQERMKKLKLDRLQASKTELKYTMHRLSHDCPALSEHIQSIIYEIDAEMVYHLSDEPLVEFKNKS